MTIKEALANGRFRLTPTSPTPALDARLLLQHLLQVSHSYLIAHDDILLSPAQLQQYQALLARAARREPIPYITGTAPFYGLDFAVTPDVLIPRPETEQLVERAVAWAKERPRTVPLRVVDVGTGSGCIAVTVARHLPQAQVTAVDVSAAALAVARRNADRLAPGRVRFYQGHLLSPLTHPATLILANLPYVTNQEWTELDDGVKLYEPAVALKGGEDGLDLIRDLLHQAVERLAMTGILLLEIGWRQGKAAQTIAQAAFPSARVRLFPDLAGHDRMVMVERVRRD